MPRRSFRTTLNCCRNDLRAGESAIDTSFKAVLLDSEMHVLLGTNPRGEGELLGGRAEAQDAAPQDTVRREVREEAGIDIVVGAIIDTWFYDVPGTHASPSPAFFHVRALDAINLPEGYRRSIRLGVGMCSRPGQGSQGCREGSRRRFLP
ncbi:NUDIX domain-containing protein [Streptomyces sp. NPDC001537]